MYDQKLIHAFISTIPDYCNILWTGITQKTSKQLRLALNDAAGLWIEQNWCSAPKCLPQTVYQSDVQYISKFSSVSESLNGLVMV